VRYLLEWIEEDVDEGDEIVSAADLEFCHPLCQCPKCAPAQKVWPWFPSVGAGLSSCGQAPDARYVLGTQ
jgi:hypothetical protein